MVVFPVGRAYRVSTLQETNDSGESNAQPNGAPLTGVNITTGSWKPQPHFVWEILLDIYFPRDGAAEIQDKTPFQEFFKAVVDGKRRALSCGWSAY